MDWKLRRCFIKKSNYGKMGRIIYFTILLLFLTEDSQHLARYSINFSQKFHKISDFVEITLREIHKKILDTINFREKQEACSFLMTYELYGQVKKTGKSISWISANCFSGSTQRYKFSKRRIAKKLWANQNLSQSSESIKTRTKLLGGKREN